MPDPFGLLGHVIDSQLRVDSFIADGESSVVYRAQHLGGGPLALKCLKTKPDPDLMQRLRRRFWEACHAIDSLAQEEAGICRVLASGVTVSPTRHQVVYMAFEWLDGQSLANDFKSRKAAGHKGRTWGEVNQLFASAAHALACGHKKGIVHRDVKPTNLFLQAQGPMKVLDFGVAKILDDEGAQGDTKSITRAPYYAAPEVFESRFGAVGPWTDVYSFSLVLLEALRDERVRAGRTYADIAHEILEHKRVPTPRALGMSVTDALESLFASALSIDPRKRPQNMAEMWSRVQRALGLASTRPPQDFATTRQASGESSFTQHMPSPSQLPSEVRRYLGDPPREKMPTPTQQFDDERTVAVQPPADTQEKLPESSTPAMGSPAFAPQMQEPSALVLTDSALVELEAASERLDKTVALPNKDSVPSQAAEPPRTLGPEKRAPVFAQTMPLAQQAPSAPKQQVFAGTMPLGGTSGVPSIALRPTEPAPAMAMAMQPQQHQQAQPIPPAPMGVPAQAMASPHSQTPRSSNRGLLWVLVILLLLSLAAAVGVALLLVERRGH